jgi:hypothetical protein
MRKERIFNNWSINIGGCGDWWCDFANSTTSHGGFAAAVSAAVGLRTMVARFLRLRLIFRFTPGKRRRIRGLEMRPGVKNRRRMQSIVSVPPVPDLWYGRMVPSCAGLSHKNKSKEAMLAGRSREVSKTNKVEAGKVVHGPRSS